jgi:hypothetical protein
VGYTAPDLDPFTTTFSDTDALFTTPTLAILPATGSTVTATTITGADAALPISAAFTSSTGICLVGDVDGNGSVTIDDIAPFVHAILDGPGDADEACRADGNQDGTLDGRDISVLVQSIMGA